MDLFDAIRSSYLTAGLTDDELRLVSKAADFVTCEPLKEIVKAKDVSYDIYVLVEGTAEVVTEAGDLITRLKTGSIIGEFAFFESGERTATVMSHGQSTLLHFRGQDLLALMEENPRIGMVIYRNLGKTLCSRLRSANVQIERLVSVI